MKLGLFSASAPVCAAEVCAPALDGCLRWFCDEIA
jgi:hypothetical protein